MPNIDPRWYLLPAAMSLIALLPLPYGFYTLLRIVVCIAAVFALIVAYRKSRDMSWQVAVFGIVAILFNPIIPIELNRGIWAFFNVAAAVLFTWHSGILRRSR